MSTPSENAKRILQKVSECRKTRAFTDFKIVCDGAEFHVHKVIICSQSPVFHAAFTGTFKESLSSEYHMMDVPILVVEKMLEYLYTGDYSEPSDDGLKNASLINLSKKVPKELPKKPVAPISALQLHAKLFALGDKYCIQDLCQMASSKYSRRVTDHFDAIECLDSIPDVFFSSLKNSEALQRAAVYASENHLGRYMRAEPVRAKYDLIIAQVPEFAKQLLDKFWANNQYWNSGRGPNY